MEALNVNFERIFYQCQNKHSWLAFEFIGKDKATVNLKQITSISSLDFVLFFIYGVLTKWEHWENIAHSR